MDKLLEYLKEKQNGDFATVDNGKPDVRPWQFQFAKDRKLYFCTANTKKVYKQMKENPNVAFSCMTSDGKTIRLYGKAEFTSDVSIKQEVLDRNEGIKRIYKSGDNPIFEVFFIEHGKAEISDFSGNPPIVIEF
ncbi:pyridoxamine 5'-phosphate oxidase family protein [Caldicellulosiruptoraceae bacterium PP1]